jgi:hypothetical protein
MPANPRIEIGDIVSAEYHGIRIYARVIEFVPDREPSLLVEPAFPMTCSNLACKADEHSKYHIWIATSVILERKGPQ